MILSQTWRILRIVLMNWLLVLSFAFVSRMNSEVAKSEQKLAKLHAELGNDKVDAWQREHAAEVLTPEQLRHMGLQPASSWPWSNIDTWVYSRHHDTTGHHNECPNNIKD